MGTWTGPDDAAADRLRAEHGMTFSWHGTGHAVVSAGNGGLLPEWPPTVNLPGLVVPLAAEPRPPTSTCAGCHTAIALRENEWRHEVGFHARGGCTEARP